MSKIKTITLSSIPIDDITFEIIKAFCEEKIKEDLDLDYKSDFPNDLARILSAFANSQGGVVLIGIKEINKSREPDCPPVGIEGDPDTLRHRVLNIAHDAIYPPIEPEIATTPIPDTARFVVTIRVSPSRLLHAVDRRSRIYIRSIDNNRGYTLASLPDLRWLWDQRERSINLRESLVVDASKRRSSEAIAFGDTETREKWSTHPHLIFTIVPSYPSNYIVKNPRILLDVVNSLQAARSTWPGVDRRVPWQDHHWRTIPRGVCITNRGLRVNSQYIEFGQYGHAFFDFLIHQFHVNALPVPRNTNENCIYAYVVLAYLDIALSYGFAFLSAINYQWPVMISGKLVEVKDILLQYVRPASPNPLAMEYLSRACTEDDVSLIEEEIMPSLLSEKHEHLLSRSTKSLFWSFGIGWEELDIEEWLQSIKQFPK